MTQKDLILTHLQRYGSITTIEAVDLFILRVSERIRELSKEGWMIKSERVQGKTYQKYTLLHDAPMKKVPFNQEKITMINAIPFKKEAIETQNRLF